MADEKSGTGPWALYKDGVQVCRSNLGAHAAEALFDVLKLGRVERVAAGCWEPRAKLSEVEGVGDEG